MPTRHDDNMEDHSAVIQQLKAELSDVSGKIHYIETEIVNLKKQAASFRNTIRYLEGKPKLNEQKSIPDLIEAILYEKGELSAKDLVQQLDERGVLTNIQTVSGALSRYIKAKKRFRRTAPNTFDLIEKR